MELTKTLEIRVETDDGNYNRCGVLCPFWNLYNDKCALYGKKMTDGTVKGEKLRLTECVQDFGV